MDSYFQVKPFQEDCLCIGRFFALTIFNNKIFKMCTRFAFFYHILILLVTNFFFLQFFNATTIYRYLPAALGALSTILVNGCFWYAEKHLESLVKAIFSVSWSIDSTTNLTKQKILTESKYVNLSIIINSCLGILTGLALTPSAIDPEHHFLFFFSRTYLQPYHTIVEVLYLFTYPILGYLMVNLASLLAYMCFHGKAQIVMGLDMFAHCTTEYSAYDESFLVNCEEYQQLIKKRIAFAVHRHNILFQIVQAVTDLSLLLAPYFALAFTLMSLCLLSYVFYLDIEYGFLLYFQHFLWIVTACVSGMLMVFWGQQIESQTGNFSDVIHNIFWLSFNHSNRKSVLLMISTTQKSAKLKFTDNLSLNYNLGIKFVRNIYSFAAVFARIRAYSN